MDTELGGRAKVLRGALDKAPLLMCVIGFHPFVIHVEPPGFSFPILYSKNPRDRIFKIVMY